MIPGIDVSHWQKIIDWKLVKKSGVRFAFIKATEFPDKQQKLWTDPNFKQNAAGCVENDILFGAYHFFRTHVNSVVQAQDFCGVIKESGFTLPPVVDLEAAGCRGPRLAEMVSNFLFTVEDILGCKPIIYTSSGFWFSYIFNGYYKNADFAIGYPLWIANYGRLFPPPLYPFAGWHFWQYSESGKVPGVITNCDLNFYSGDTLSLARLSSNTFPEEQPA